MRLPSHHLRNVGEQANEWLRVTEGGHGEG